MVMQKIFFPVRASLGTSFSKVIFIFSSKNKLFFLRKMEIPCKMGSQTRH